MNLESASYVAGIVGAVAGVASAYFAWKHHRKERQQKKMDDKVACSVVDSVAVEAPKGKSTDPLSEWNKRKARVEMPDNVSEALVVAFTAAKAMWNKPARDSALVEVARDALNMQRFDFAIAVAAAMWNAPATDALLTEIVSQSLDQGNLAQARNATEIFFNLPNKDKAIRMIVEKTNLGYRGRQKAAAP